MSSFFTALDNAAGSAVQSTAAQAAAQAIIASQNTNNPLAVQLAQSATPYVASAATQAAAQAAQATQAAPIIASTSTAAASATVAASAATAATAVAAGTAVKSNVITRAAGGVVDETKSLFKVLFGSTTSPLSELAPGRINDYVNAIMTLNLFEHFKKNINTDSEMYITLLSLFTENPVDMRQVTPSEYIYFNALNKIEDYTGTFFQLPATMSASDAKSIKDLVALRLTKLNVLMSNIKSRHSADIYESYANKSLIFALPGLIILLIIIAYYGIIIYKQVLALVEGIF